MKLFSILVSGIFALVCSGTLNASYVGVLDTSFVPLLFSGAEVQVTARAGGSQLLVGGNFDWISNQPSAFLARVNLDGSLDSSFAPAQPADFDRVLTLTAQADGKVLLGYANSLRVYANFHTPSAEAPVYPFGPSGARLIRLNADGSLDSSFTGIDLNTPVAGIVGDSPVLSFVLPGADGKILVGGSFTGVNGVPNSYLASFNADGTVDQSFGVQVNGSVESALRLGDGSTVIGGQFTQTGKTKLAFGMLKLTKTGVRDLSFVPKGKPKSGKIIGITGGMGSTMLVTSLTQTLNNNVVVGDSKSHLEMISATGTFMRTYAANVLGRSVGLALTGGGHATMVTARATSSVVMGSTPIPLPSPRSLGFSVFATVSSSATAKVTAPQSVSLTYRPNGVTPTGAGLMAYGFSGSSTGATPSLSGFQLLQAPVQGTAARPKTPTLPPGFEAWVGTSAIMTQVASSPGSKLLVAGNFTFGIARDGSLQNRIGLAKLTSSGAVDATFAPAALGVRQFIANSDGGATVVGTLPRAAPTATAGAVYPGNALFQLTSAGALDPAFHVSTASAAPVLYASTSLLRQQDGKLVVGSNAYAVGQTVSIPFDYLYTSVLQRFQADGAADILFQPSFAGSAGDPSNANVTTLRLDADGSLLVSGSFATVNGIARKNVVRLLLDGTVDLVNLSVALPDNFLDVLPRSDGGYLITAPFLSLFVINGGGTLDATPAKAIAFPVSGITPTTPLISPFLATINSGASYPAFSVPYLVPTSNPGSGPIINLSYGVKLITPDPVGGWVAMTYNLDDQVANTAASLVHVNADGSLDENFDAPKFTSKSTNNGPYVIWWGWSPKPADYVNSLIVLRDGSVIVAGNFWAVNGEGRSGLAKLRLVGRVL